MTPNRLAAVQRIAPDVSQLPATVYDRTRKQLAAALGMVLWWALVVTVPILGLVCGTIYGAIVGAASGAAAGVTEAKADLERWWRLLTDGEGP